MITNPYNSSSITFLANCLKSPENLTAMLGWRGRPRPRPRNNKLDILSITSKTQFMDWWKWITRSFRTAGIGSFTPPLFEEKHDLKFTSLSWIKKGIDNQLLPYYISYWKKYIKQRNKMGSFIKHTMIWKHRKVIGC